MSILELSFAKKFRISFINVPTYARNFIMKYWGAFATESSEVKNLFECLKIYFNENINIIEPINRVLSSDYYGNDEFLYIGRRPFLAISRHILKEGEKYL